MKYLLLAVALLVSSKSFAEETGNYKMYGFGYSSCGSWLDDRKGDGWYGKGQWMLGTISAVGYYGVFKLKELDSVSFALWMDNYCKANPLSTLSEGTHQLVLELKIN
jgi:hypothetical protein